MEVHSRPGAFVAVGKACCQLWGAMREGCSGAGPGLGAAVGSPLPRITHSGGADLASTAWEGKEECIQRVKAGGPTAYF